MTHVTNHIQLMSQRPVQRLLGLKFEVDFLEEDTVYMSRCVRYRTVYAQIADGQIIGYKSFASFQRWLTAVSK